MAFGLPNLSFVGYPVAVPCPPHSGLGVRQAMATDTEAVVEHFLALTRDDLRMRFCATLNEAAIRRHVEGLWDRDGLILAAFDGPLWPGPLHKAGPIRALAELLATAEGEAEFGISVDASLRRRGIATYLLQVAACMLGPRGVRIIRATTPPDNNSFIAMSRAAGAEIRLGLDGVDIAFDVATLQRAYRQRRASDVLGLSRRGTR